MPVAPAQSWEFLVHPNPTSPDQQPSGRSALNPAAPPDAPRPSSDPDDPGPGTATTSPAGLAIPVDSTDSVSPDRTVTTTEPTQPATSDEPDSSDDSAQARAGLTVHVDGIEVLVSGTRRGDTEVIAVLKVAGFRWFRSLGAWGLPRNLRPATRHSKVQWLVAGLAEIGWPVTVEDTGQQLTAEQRRQARDERLADRADVLAERAGRNRTAADAAHATADRIFSGYNGQPILVGHHSERRHRRDLDRADRALRASFEAADVAADQQRRADQIRAHLERGDHPVTIKQRLARNEAELRKLQRALARHPDASDAWRTRLEAESTALTDEIDLDRAVLAELAGRGETRDWGPSDFRRGDLVAFHGLGWYEVRRVNKSTLTVPSHVGGDWTDTVPYAKVIARSRDGITQTAADLLALDLPVLEDDASDPASTQPPSTQQPSPEPTPIAETPELERRGPADGSR